MKYAALVAALLALAATGVNAQDALPAVSFGEPGYGGSGCPDGTGIAIRGFSNQAAAYVFDAYKVGDNGRAVDRKTCAVAIPVDVPDGVSVAVRNVEVSVREGVCDRELAIPGCRIGLEHLREPDRVRDRQRACRGSEPSLGDVPDDACCEPSGWILVEELGE